MSSTFDYIIVGAGPAGMTAGLELKKRNASFCIIEARDTIGGRVRRVDDSFDVDIRFEIGGSFVHNLPKLERLAKSIGVDKIPEHVPLRPLSFRYWSAESSWGRWGNPMANDRIWVNNTWFRFFETNVYPEIANDIRFGHSVKEMDYSDPSGVKITCQTNAIQGSDETEESVFIANKKVLITVSPGILKSGNITFQPTLPEKVQSSIDKISFQNAIKMNIHFKTKFYGDKSLFSLQSKRDGMKGGYEDFFFWEASYKQGQDDTFVLGCLLQGETGQVNRGSDTDELFARILKLLDEAFDNEATPNLVQKTVKDWSQDPYALGSWTDYQYGNTNWRSIFKRMAATPVDGRIYFAGEYLAFDGWHGTVDSAAMSGQTAARFMLGEINSPWNGPGGLGFFGSLLHNIK